MSKRLGVIINPLAGIGGRVGLKGSDGIEIQREALARGAVPEAQSRAITTLAELGSIKDTLDIITCSGEMGETAVQSAGLVPASLVPVNPGTTTAEDTRRAAKTMQQMSVDLLLFAGGDGTARDICGAVGTEQPCLGIPAGVKIHSAAFATHPRHAGELAVLYLLRTRTSGVFQQEQATVLREVEVIDLDEEAYRQGVVATRLYGYLKIPFRRHLVQNQKVPSPVAEIVQARAIAEDVIENMQADTLYILGPGTTTRPIAERLGLSKTLVGVDVVTREGVILLDACEAQLLELIKDRPARIVVTPIGGQGFIFGRGNQPLSPRVLEIVGKNNLIVVSTTEKIHALGGRPLLVDTGSAAIDAMLSGYITVITGYHERIVYQVSS